MWSFEAKGKMHGIRNKINKSPLSILFFFLLLIRSALDFELNFLCVAWFAIFFFFGFHTCLSSKSRLIENPFDIYSFVFLQKTESKLLFDEKRRKKWADF